MLQSQCKILVTTSLDYVKRFKYKLSSLSLLLIFIKLLILWNFPMLFGIHLVGVVPTHLVKLDSDAGLIRYKYKHICKICK